MIESFKHKGLERFFKTGSTARIRNEHEKRLRLILARLQAATEPRDMNLPGLKLHELKGRQKGRWSVWVSGNWRVTFKFKGVDTIDVDYEDYH
ncbi:MAG: type II toxin-antitoxin system RelE/ParE family toxin [Pseudomonadota bacterium]